MKTVHTYCRICEPACALLADVDGAKVRLRPDKAHPVHKGFACHKGLRFTEVHEDPDRLDQPRRRNDNGAFDVIDWDTATEEIAARLQAVQERHGGEAIATYFGNPSAFNSTGRQAAGEFARQLGVRYGFGSGTQDCANKFATSEAVFGTVNLHPIPDFPRTRFLLSIGANPKVSHMSFVHTTDPMQHLRGIVARGGRVVHVNPRRIESATPATGDVFQIKPDTDLYLLAAMIHETFANGWHDDDLLSVHAARVDELRAFVARYPAERVAAVCGVTPEAIRELARDFSAAEGASVHASTGLNMGRQGTLAYWLVQMLSLVTGNLGRPGGNIYSPGFFPAATVGLRRQDDPYFDTEFGPLRRVAGSLPANLLPDFIDAGKVKALVCMSGNPLLSVAGEARMRQAFEQLELLIVVDIYPNATAQIADYQLPATDWLERPDVNSLALGFQPEPYVQYTEAVVPPRAERRPEWWIFARLQQALGLPSLLDDANANPLARVDHALGKGGLSLQSLAAAPGGTVVLPLPEPGALFELGIQNPDGRIDCCPPLFTGAIARAEQIYLELAAEPESQLKLITLRTNYMVNSWFHNVPSMKRAHVLDNPLWLHPKDAERLGVADGDCVRVATGSGAIDATVALSADLRPGVVAMTHGWGHNASPGLKTAANHPGVNVNQLLPSGPGSFEPLSNQAHMTGIPVSVTPG